MSETAEDEVEVEVADLVQAHGEDGSAWLARKPLVTARLVRLLLKLRRLEFASSGSIEGEMIRRALDRGRTPLHRTSSVLALPDRPGAYSVGRRRATQRRKARKARQAGVTFREVDSADERFELLETANAYERQNPDRRYRSSHPQNDDLLGIRLWLVAEVAGKPVMLVVAAVDGSWGLQRYFRSLDTSQAASDARYLMVEALADALVERGVRHLADASNPLGLPPGLRHFARMVGFRYRLVRVAA